MWNLIEPSSYFYHFNCDFANNSYEFILTTDLRIIYSERIDGIDQLLNKLHEYMGDIEIDDLLMRIHSYMNPDYLDKSTSIEHNSDDGILVKLETRLGSIDFKWNFELKKNSEVDSYSILQTLILFPLLSTVRIMNEREKNLMELMKKKDLEIQELIELVGQQKLVNLRRTKTDKYVKEKIEAENFKADRDIIKNSPTQTFSLILQDNILKSRLSNIEMILTELKSDKYHDIKQIAKSEISETEEQPLVDVTETPSLPVSTSSPLMVHKPRINAIVTKIQEAKPKDKIKKRKLF